jgi:acyl carrier protein
MVNVSEELRQEIVNLVKEYFAEECEVDIERITDDTLIIEDLDGDSLMFLSLLELVKKKYNIEVEIRSLGKKLMDQEVNTISQAVDMVLLFLEHSQRSV